MTQEVKQLPSKIKALSSNPRKGEEIFFQVWWHKLATSALGRLRQEDRKFQDTLGSEGSLKSP